MQKYIWILLTLNIWCIAVNSQEKRPLSIDDFKNWNTIENPVISNDGTIVVFEQAPQKGDGNLIIKFGNGEYDTIPRGANPVVGPENDFILFLIKQPEDTIRKAKTSKKKDDELPRDSLGILNLASRQIFKFSRLKSVKTADENVRWIPFAIVPEKPSNDSISKNKSVKKTKPEVENLILFNLKTADTILVSSVTEYHYSKKGTHIYYNIQLNDSISVTSTLYRFNTVSRDREMVFSDRGTLKKVVSDDSGDKYAFLFSKDTVDNKVFSLFFGTTVNPPGKIIDGYTPGIPIGWSPSEHSEIFFSGNFSKLWLGTAKDPVPEKKDSILQEDKPRLDIWNWQDKMLQPQQLAEMEKEKQRTYLAVYHIDIDRFVQLADPDIRNVNLIKKGDANVGLGNNEQPYLRESGWTGKSLSDFYVVDLKSGIKREVVRAKTDVVLSPRGKYVVWYEPEDSSYYSLNTLESSTKPVSLTKIIPVNFCDELNDRPMDPQPYGIAGWSEDDRFVYIYDRYDIWKIDPSGVRVPVCITQAYGRRNNIRLRYMKLDPELEHIPSDQPALLNAFNMATMQNGFYKAAFNLVSDPQLLVMGNFHFDNVKKAKNASKLIFTKENVTDFPDLWYCDTDFSGCQKISNANPQQCNFSWPTVQLEEWISSGGEKLKGLLYIPENIDTTKKYPLLVYYYERNSENLFRHQHPSPSRSVINKTFYASNGYIVFVPDIVYKTGYPGHSAYEAVVGGTQYLLNKYSFIDSKKTGLQGQSWGGYQTAWLITRTSMFAAAMAGAPVSNMTSAYGGIRWETGLSRMFQYEHQQSRIGGSLWEKHLLYIENSPLFYAPAINTPLLMMHNDNDGAVPWYQGIELFVALRRLEKPVWLLNYNGEPHNLKATSWANRIDLSTRMFQFFNHYLKNQPMPDWMSKGVPAVKKGNEFGY